MDRRHFLTALISGAVLDPERLLWKPGKLISIPAVSTYELYDVEWVIIQGVLMSIYNQRDMLLRPSRCALRMPWTAGVFESPS